MRALFRSFANVRVEARNFDSLRWVPRPALLGNLDRLLGLDLCIVAQR